MSVTRSMDLQRLDASSTQWLREAVSRQIDAFDCDFGLPAEKLQSLISNLRQIVKRSEDSSCERSSAIVNVRAPPRTNGYRSWSTRALPAPAPESNSSFVVPSPRLPALTNSVSTVKSTFVETVRDINESDSEDESKSTSDDDGFTLHVPVEVKRRLEDDYHLIKHAGSLIQIPVALNSSVVDILEDYVKYFGLKRLLNWLDNLDRWSVEMKKARLSFESEDRVNSGRKKRSSRSSSKDLSSTLENDSHGPTEENDSDTTETSSRHHFDLNILMNRIEATKKEIDDLRILFDFLAHHCLLYKEENCRANRLKFIEVEYNPRENCGNPLLQPLIRRCQKAFSEDRTISSASLEITNLKKRARHYSQDLIKWRLLPKSEYLMTPPHPSLIYGLIHLMRILVRLSPILNDMNMTDDDIKSTVKIVNDLTRFVARYDVRFNDHIRYERTTKANK